MVTKLKTVVIGAGPAGYTFAIRASQLGKEVTLFEREYFGGNCLNVGCIPTKALANASLKFYEAKTQSQKLGLEADNVRMNWEKTQDWKDNEVVKPITSGVEQILNKNKVEVIKGEVSFIDNKTISVNGEEYTFDEIAIAVGGRPSEPEGFTYSDRVLNTTTALSLKELPESIVLTAGGYLGAQFAAVFGRLGAKTTVLEPSKQLVGFFEPDVDRALQSKFDEYEDTTIITGATATKAEEQSDKVIVTYEKDGEEHTIEAGHLLVNASNDYNTDSLHLENTDVEVNHRGKVKINDKLQSNVDGIYALGDASERGGSATIAYHHAKVAAAIVAGEDTQLDPNKVFPSTMVSSLEVGNVGMTKSQAKDAGYKVGQKKFLNAANGRAQGLNETEGFIKLIFDKDSNKLLGAQIVGARATDTISELTLAIEKGLSLEDIADTIHSHPSIAEAIMDSAEAALGIPIHG